MATNTIAPHNSLSEVSMVVLFNDILKKARLQYTNELIDNIIPCTRCERGFGNDSNGVLSGADARRLIGTGAWPKPRAAVDYGRACTKNSTIRG